MLPQLPKVVNYGRPVNRSAPLNRGLVGWWKSMPQRHGGNRAIDLCGKSDGVFTNGVTTAGLNYPGHSWGSFQFSDNGYHSHGTRIVMPSTSITMTGWFRATTVDSTNRYVCGVQNSGLDNGRFVRLNSSNKLQFEIIGSAVKDANSTATISANKWYFFAAVKDDAGPTGYIYLADPSAAGVSVDSVSLSGVTYSATNNGFVIGARPDGPTTLKFAGQIDDIRLYFRALPSEEVYKLYAASLGGYAAEINWLERPWMLNSTAAPGGSKPFFYNRYVVGRSR